MTLFEAILLGVVQGITEFLPISSDGHLALAEQWLGIDEAPLTMTVLLHAGTLGVVVGVFRREIAQALRGAARGIVALMRGGRAREVLVEDAGARLALYVIVATLPTGIIGLLLEHPTEELARSPLAVGGFLALSGVAVFATRFFRVGQGRMNIPTALLVGVVQGLAVLPGLSRSATTISAALGCGISREEAARFSFLASVPAVAGAVLLKVSEALTTELANPGLYLAGVIFSGLTGWVAVKLLYRLVRGGHFWWFAVYLFPVSAIVVLVAV